VLFGLFLGYLLVMWFSDIWLQFQCILCCFCIWSLFHPCCTSTRGRW